MREAIRGKVRADPRSYCILVAEALQQADRPPAAAGPGEAAAPASSGADADASASAIGVIEMYYDAEGYIIQQIRAGAEREAAAQRGDSGGGGGSSSEPTPLPYSNQGPPAGYQDCYGYLASMAVARAHRRAGCARALMAAAEDVAAVQGLPWLALRVHQDNADALSLYQATGFTELDRSPSRGLLSALGRKPWALFAKRVAGSAAAGA